MTAPPDEHLHLAAWLRIAEVGPRRAEALATHFGSFTAAWRASPGALAAAEGITQRLAASLAAERARLDPVALWAADEALGDRFVARGDDDYPPCLLTLPDPPPALWIRGLWPLPDRAVAVVGARAATPYGERLAKRIGRDLAEAGVAVVSGAAAGIDRAAHEGALETGFTVAVLGCGLRHVYPAHHRALYRDIALRGTLISEFPPEAPPVRGSFPRRNRLIAALAQGVVVVEARAKSGSLITVDFALDLGLDVFACPGPVGAPGSEGPHALIRDGATLVRDAGDVLDMLGWARPAAAPPLKLDPVCTAALAVVGLDATPFDRLVAASGLLAGQLGAALVTLELLGLVRALPGARYVRT